MALILCIDDEEPLMRALCDTLESKGYTTSGFTSARAALAALRGDCFDVVLTDLMMPEMDGISVLDEAFQIDPNLVGIVMTGHGSVNTAVDALKTGAVDYILKPFKLASILPVAAIMPCIATMRSTIARDAAVPIGTSAGPWPNAGFVPRRFH